MNTPDLPTWRMLPGPDGHFSWSPAGGDAQSQPAKPRRIPILRGGKPALPRVPSMADLLLQAPPELLEGCGRGEGSGIPMFRTGSGRSVSVKQSSVQKAASVLGEPDRSGSLFSTGSGRSVSVRESSMQKAASILGESGESEREMIFGRGVVAAPMFQTGLGKPIGVKQSSIVKAVSVLREKENVEIDLMQKCNQSAGFNFSSSLLQTGSGRTVNISSAGVRRAAALLGLDENHVPVAQCIEHRINQAGKDIANGRENSYHPARLSMNPGTVEMPFVDPGGTRQVHRNSFTSLSCEDVPTYHIENAALQNLKASDIHTSASMASTIKFHTAGGRSLSISDDALRRARNLLGELDSGIVQIDSNTEYLTSSVTHEILYENSLNKEKFHYLDKDLGTTGLLRIPLGGSQCTTEHSVAAPKSIISPGNQVNKNDFASEIVFKSNSRTIMQNVPREIVCATNKLVESLRKESGGRSLRKPLLDISNKIGSGIPSQMHFSGEKKRHMKSTSISAFKKPRICRFSTPLTANFSFPASGQSAFSTSKECYQRIKVSTRFPFQLNRKSILEFFGGPRNYQNSLIHLSDQVRHMNADKAAIYRFTESNNLEGIGADNLQHMLIQSGASSLKATKEWVQNHYKWILWKLACLERSYPHQAKGKYLTVANVLEELKYRYEREVNHGHRSAVKRILEGDASPSAVVVLCVSAIHAMCKTDDPNSVCEDVEKLRCYDGPKSSHTAKIELTDGWYSLDATLDGALSKHLLAGKLFVGQKLWILGAALCGWVGPLSPLEACKMVSLQLHINGTYRAHWAERLGFCKGFKFPLAFRCIKAAGGQIPKTLIGIARIYPILYKERFSDGGSIVRSERMENNMLHLYNQRRFLIAEDIMSEQDKGLTETDNDNEEGAKIFKILEMSAEPDLLMADMTSDQLMSFSNYQAKQKAIKQDNVQKKIEKALEDAGLSSREVTPFMRVRVVGLTHKGSSRKGSPRQGLITIWNPTEKQKVDLVEGQMYSVSGLMPLNGGSDIIYLQARGSTSIWRALSSKESERFEPFFNPRCSILLSALGEVPLASEFDIAAIILYVGDVFITGHQKKQWVFMTDGSQSSSESQQEGTHNCLLAVSFCLPVTGTDLSALVNPMLLGSTVCFYNLVKKARDQLNHLWVAEATENSTYSLINNLPINSHLRKAANHVKKWADDNPSTLQKLKETVLHILGSCGG